MTDEGTSSYSEELDRYLLNEEDVEIVSQGATRTFAVTDRRVIDIETGENSQGRSIENVRTTFFDHIADASLSIQDSITETDTNRRILGVVVGLVGLLIFYIGGTGPAGDGVFALVGLIVAVLGVWLWASASETIPGGIIIYLTHDSGSDTPDVRYRLPQDQRNTARTVVRMAGKTGVSAD